jgi:hypothetical protein
MPHPEAVDDRATAVVEAHLVAFAYGRKWHIVTVRLPAASGACREPGGVHFVGALTKTYLERSASNGQQAVTVMASSIPDT